MNGVNILSFGLQCGALLFLAFEAFHLFQTPPKRPAWGWLGLFLWLLSLMIGAIALHPIGH